MLRIRCDDCEFELITVHSIALHFELSANQNRTFGQNRAKFYDKPTSPKNVMNIKQARKPNETNIAQ